MLDLHHTHRLSLALLALVLTGALLFVGCGSDAISSRPGSSGTVPSKSTVPAPASTQPTTTSSPAGPISAPSGDGEAPASPKPGGGCASDPGTGEGSCTNGSGESGGTAVPDVTNP